MSHFSAVCATRAPTSSIKSGYNQKDFTKISSRLLGWQSTTRNPMPDARSDGQAICSVNAKKSVWTSTSRRVPLKWGRPIDRTINRSSQDDDGHFLE